MRFLMVAAIAAGVASAQDAQLAALHKTLVELRSGTPADLDYETLGATEKLTVAKHQLRDWIESRLVSLKDDGDTKALADRMNQALKAVSAGGPENDQNLLGSLGHVQFSSESGLLIVTTGVGIECQLDQSAYAYRRTDDQWQRVWETEQNDYRKGKYTPQFIDALYVFQPSKDGHEEGPPFVMTLGNEWGCVSSWHDVMYRVWRLDSARPKLLIDRTELAFLRAAASIVGSLSQRYDEKAVNVLVEFTGRSIDASILARGTVRHFQIDGDRVIRVDPVALSPRDFVEEWLTLPWAESARWSATPVLKRGYDKQHPDPGGLFGETMHCGTPDLWQVTLSDTYFLVRWRPPYRFTMVGIGDDPWPRCTEKDPEADAWRTLFATQEWMR